MSKITHMDIKEFRETGYLQEANRLFFHPHGLALEITVIGEEIPTPYDSEITLPDNMSLAERKRFKEIASILCDACGDRYDTNYTEWVTARIYNHLYPSGSEFISGVWDDRDDPEGIWFDFPTWVDPLEAQSKAANVLQERTKHAANRAMLFLERYKDQARTYMYRDTVSGVEPLWQPEDQ